jgi:REP element-mobilizing transposase RayT
MARRLRIHVSGAFYHVTLRGNHQQPIFFAPNDRGLLNSIVEAALEKFGGRLHAYCWMTNHLHLLLQAGADPISKLMHKVASEYARAMQLKLETTGHFFERRFHATLVDVDAYLKQLLRYIHLNPVEAGLTADPAHYPWSSHRNYLEDRYDPWVTTDFALAMFGETRPRAVAAYRAFIAVEAGVSWHPGDALHDGAEVLGGDDFLASLGQARPHCRSRQSLDQLIAEACARFEVDPGVLISPVRSAYLTQVRGWIARQAAARGIATISHAARALNRTEGALRHAIRNYPNEVE